LSKTANVDAIENQALKNQSILHSDMTTCKIYFLQYATWDIKK